MTVAAPSALALLSCSTSSLSAHLKVAWLKVNLSHAMDDLFDLPHKTTLSQRDVPGMTRGVVPLLQELNVSGITVGLNGGFCSAWVPYPLFRWVGGWCCVSV